MARVHGGNARIYLNQYDLSGRANGFDLNINTPSVNVTAFSDVAEEYVQGNNQHGWDASVQSFIDYTSGDIDTIINALLADNDLGHALGLYTNGSAAGSRGYEGVGGLEREGIVVPRDGVGQLRFDMKGAGAQMVGRAMKLNEGTVLTGTSTQTGQNHMTATDGDLIISVARITAVTGTGSITIRVQESTDNASSDAYGTVLTHAAMTAVGENVKTVTAASMPGPWFRTIITAFSSFTNVTLRHAIAIVPNG